MYPTRFGRIRGYGFIRTRDSWWIWPGPQQRSMLVQVCALIAYLYWLLSIIMHSTRRFFVESLDLQTCFSMHAIEVPILLQGSKWRYQKHAHQTIALSLENLGHSQLSQTILLTPVFFVSVFCISSSMESICQGVSWRLDPTHVTVVFLFKGEILQSLSNDFQQSALFMV